MNLVDEFIIYLRSEKGLSNHSVEAYSRDVRLFLNDKDVTTLKEEDLIKHLSNLKLKGYASATCARSLISIKVFFRFLFRENYLSSNWTHVFDTPKIWQLIPEVLTEHEVIALLEAPDTQTFEGMRDRAILEVFYASGLRVSELCGLSIQDVGDESIRVLGKGGKERLVPVGKKALASVDAYLVQHRDHFPDKKFLFLTKKGKPLNRIEVWKRVKNYAKKAGIEKNISPHTLRHSFATHLLDHGAELRVIQDMLGHASIATTDKYTHISRNKLQESFLKYHPKQ